MLETIQSTTTKLATKSPAFTSTAKISSDNEQSSDFHVPTIDIGPYLANPDSPGAQSVVARVRGACETHGFFQITNHGIPPSLQRAVFRGAREFFALPYDVKKALDAKTTKGHRGYDVLASQSYEEGVAPDLKEGFYVGNDMPADHAHVQNSRFFAGSNVWPAELPASTLREPCVEYHTALTKLSKTVLQLLADTLPFGRDIFDDFVRNDPITPMRMLHYPPMRDAANSADAVQKQFGASAHTDFGAITLLLQEDTPGLEVQNPRSKEWVSVAPNTDAYVVNVGDMLTLWTSGRYVSSVHRVINQSPGDRYSVVFFFDGNPDTLLAPLDGSSPGKTKAMSVEEYMNMRMTKSYGKEAKAGAAK